MEVNYSNFFIVFLKSLCASHKAHEWDRHENGWMRMRLNCNEQFCQNKSSGIELQNILNKKLEESQKCFKNYFQSLFSSIFVNF